MKRKLAEIWINIVVGLAVFSPLPSVALDVYETPVSQLPYNPVEVKLLSTYYTSSAITLIAETPGKMDAITDAVCRAFKAGIKSPHSQATSAYAVMSGAQEPAFSSSIGTGPSVQSIVRGIETCLDEKLDYAVALEVRRFIAITGFDTQPNPEAYEPPKNPGASDDPDEYTDVCVSNCI